MPTDNNAIFEQPSHGHQSTKARHFALRAGVVLLVISAWSFAWGQAPSTNHVRALREQARVAYPVAFVDRDLWKATIEEAQSLEAQHPQDLEVQRLMAEIYTESKWWIRAWEAWQNYRQLGGDWDGVAREQAILAANALVFYADRRGDSADAEAWRQQVAALSE